jgi:hypothetical protein
MDLPSWAVAITYEYDLDMSTACEHCMNTLEEGATVYKDAEARNTYYCSEACVRIAEDGAPTCDWCGEPKEFLDEVDDSDPSVGYRSMLTLCPECKTRRRIGTPLPPGDEADEPWYEIAAQDAGLRTKVKRSDELWFGRSSRTPFTKVTIDPEQPNETKEADHDAP